MRNWDGLLICHRVASIAVQCLRSPHRQYDVWLTTVLSRPPARIGEFDVGVQDWAKGYEPFVCYAVRPIALSSGVEDTSRQACDANPSRQDCLEDRRESTIELDEEQVLAVAEPDTTTHFSLQHNQLLPERGIFGLKSFWEFSGFGLTRFWTRRYDAETAPWHAA